MNSMPYRRLGKLRRVSGADLTIRASQFIDHFSTPSQIANTKRSFMGCGMSGSIQSIAKYLDGSDSDDDDDADDRVAPIIVRTGGRLLCR